MYEDDTPPAERRAQALSLDRDLLRELLGQEELRELIDPDALAEVERQLRGDPRDPDELHDVLRRRGDLRRGRVRRGPGGDPARRAPRSRRSLRGRGTAGRRRGRRALPRCARRDAARRAPRGLPRRRRPTRSVSSCSGSRRAAARSRPPRPTSASASRSRACCTSSSAPTCSSAASCGRAAASASGATPRCSAACAEPRSPRCAARSSRPSRRRSAASCRRGTGSAAGRACARRSSRSRVSRSRCRCGRARCCRDASRATSPRGSTPSAPPASSSGSAPASTGSPSTSARTRRSSALPPARRRRSPRRPRKIREALGRSAMFWADLLGRDRARGRGGVARALGARLGRRGHERRVDAAARRPPLSGSARRAPAPTLLAHARRCDHVDAGPLVADRAPVRRRARPARARGAAARAAGHRHARRRARRGDPGRLRRRLLGAQGSRDDRRLPARLLRRRVSAAPSSRFPARSSACASCARKRSPSRSCSRPPIPPSRTAPPCRGRSAPARAPHASREPRSCCSEARLRSSSSVGAGRSCRCAIPTRNGCGRPSRRSSTTFGREAPRRLAVERFDGRPVTETEIMPLLVEAGFLAGPRRAVLRP